MASFAACADFTAVTLILRKSQSSSIIYPSCEQRSPTLVSVHSCPTMASHSTWIDERGCFCMRSLLKMGSHWPQPYCSNYSSRTHASPTSFTSASRSAFTHSLSSSNTASFC